MAAEFVLFAELLIFLIGTFVYGFLARELHRRPTVLPGNRAMRVLAVCLTVWYAGCLVDEVAGILMGELPHPLELELGRGRGLSWVLSFPLLAHALWRLRRSGGYCRQVLRHPAARFSAAQAGTGSSPGMPASPFSSAARSRLWAAHASRSPISRTRLSNSSWFIRASRP